MILVAEDDADLRLALKLRLLANGYRVVEAADGMTALSQVHEFKPNLILLDLGMPRGDGFSVMDSLNKHENTASIPVIVLTGRDRNGSLDPSLDSGARAFLQKPVQNVRLLALIQRELHGGHNYEKPKSAQTV